MRPQHVEVGQRLSACFSAGFNHAGSAIDHGFRVLLLLGAWLLYAAGRVLSFLALQAAEWERGVGAPTSIQGTTVAELRAGEERKRIADAVRQRSAGSVPLQFLPKGTIEKWYVPEDKGWN